jgi:PhnB protein
VKLNPHLCFGGDCEAAFRLYEQCFDGKVLTMITYGNSPMAEQTPPEWHGKIMHATLSIGGDLLMGADLLPGQYEKPKGISMLVGIEDPVAAERIFGVLAENGTVQMPLQKTFWAERFGVLVDRFGVPWEINCEQPQ